MLVVWVIKLGSTSVPLSTMLDDFEGFESVVNVPVPSANRPTPWFRTVNDPSWKTVPDSGAEVQTHVEGEVKSISRQ